MDKSPNDDAAEAAADAPEQAPSVNETPDPVVDSIPDAASESPLPSGETAPAEEVPGEEIPGEAPLGEAAPAEEAPGEEAPLEEDESPQGEDASPSDAQALEGDPPSSDSPPADTPEAAAPQAGAPEAASSADAASLPAPAKTSGEFQRNVVELRKEIQTEEEPFREGRFFDNPSLGRAIRYTFAEKRLARAVFINALLLVVALAGIQEIFGRAQLGLFHQDISYGRLAFLGAILIETVIVSILTPISFMNLFEAERREECFDQVVVSGVSPHRVVFGRFFATLAFVSLVLFSSLPFFVTTVVLDGATLPQVAEAYLVLLGYMVCLASLTAAVAVGFDDTGLPFMVVILAVATALAGGFSRGPYPELAAWSPLRHAVIDLNDMARGLRLGSFKSPTPFGVATPATLLGLGYYFVLSGLSLIYVYVGPDLELSEGLDSFDSVALSRETEARRARRGMAKTLLRIVQVRFFYENLSDRAQALSPFLRAVATSSYFGGLHVVVLAALWPDAAPKAFQAITKSTVYPYLGFCFVSLTLLALTAAGARSAYLARSQILLGPLRLGRFPATFLIFFVALLVPPALWELATSLSGYGGTTMDPVLIKLYLLVAGYATLAFLVALTFSFSSTNPISATGRTFISLSATNVLPLLWVPLFTGNVLGRGSSFLIDLSPMAAAYAILRPGDTIPFARFENDEPVQFDHAPSWVPFVVFHTVIAIVCLVSLVILLRRERKSVAAREANS